MNHTSTLRKGPWLLLLKWYNQLAGFIVHFFSYRYRIIVSVFFGTYLLAGVLLAGDYGTTADEWVHCRNRGVIFVNLTANYLKTWLLGKHNPAFEALYANYDDKDYGAVYEMAMVGVEAALGLKEERSITLSRHIFVFVVFWLSVYFFYQLISQRFYDWRMGLLGALLLILSPRIFADSFYNSKDIGFLSAFVFSLYSLVKFLEQPTIRRAMIHAVCCAILIDIRIMGIIVPAVTFAFFGMELLKAFPDHKRFVRTIFGLLSLYVVVMLVAVVVMWPYLWEDPVGNLVTSFRNMSRFKRIDGDGMQLFMGQYLHITRMPRYYLPVWMGVTTPLVYLAFFGIGLLFILFRFIRAHVRVYRNSLERFDLLMLAFLAGPVLAVAILHSTVYDGWRHLYYTYPCLVAIALIGLVSLSNWLRGRLETDKARMVVVGLYLILLGGMAHTAYFMAKYHPQQQVYFNALAGSPASYYYEQDYYGLSCKQGLEYIVKHDDRNTIKVYVNYIAGETNQTLLRLNDSRRIQYVKDSTQADYFLTSFTKERDRQRMRRKEFPFVNEVHALTVEGSKIMAVYKLKGH